MGAAISSHRRLSFKSQGFYLFFFFFLQSWKVFQVHTEIFLQLTLSAFCTVLSSLHLHWNTRAKPYKHSKAKVSEKPPGDTKHQAHSTGRTLVGPRQSQTLNVPLVSQAICSVNESQRSFCTCCSVLACLQLMHCEYNLLHPLLTCEGLKRKTGQPIAKCQCLRKYWTLHSAYCFAAWNLLPVLCELAKKKVGLFPTLPTKKTPKVLVGLHPGAETNHLRQSAILLCTSRFFSFSLLAMSILVMNRYEGGNEVFPVIRNSRYVGMWSFCSFPN